MNPRPDLPALHLLNTVFAGVTGQDLYLAEQMRAGIELALADSGAANRTPEAFAAAIESLRQKLGHAPDGGFFHWDAAQSPAAPDSLWSRQQVLEGLKRLAPYREATLLVTNLRSALCPPGHRWTDRRRAAYRDALAFLDNLTATHKRPSASVKLIVL